MMLRKHWLSLLLVVISMGLAAYVLLIDKDKITDQERSDRPKNVFPVFRKDDVTRIELQIASSIFDGSATPAENLVFERTKSDDSGNRDWQMTSPRKEKAEDDAVDRLMGALEFATFIRKVDANTAGIQPPRVTGTLTMGKMSFHFSLGQPASSPEGASFFTVDGEGSFVVSKEFATQLLLGANAYRSKSIVPYLSIDLSQLAVRSDVQNYAIVRKDDMAFVFADTGLRVSREKLDRVWLAFADMRADAFLNDVDDSHPAYVIQMTPKEAKPPGELAVLGACPTIPEDVIIVRRLPTRLAVCVPKIVLEGLATPRADLLDNKLFSAHEDEVEEITFEALPSGPKINLARKGTGWHLRLPEDRELAGDEIDVTNALVGSIVHGVGTNVVKGETCPTTSRVTIVRVESQVVETVEVGLCADKQLAVLRNLDGTRLTVTADLARQLTPRLFALKGRTIFPTPIEQHDALSLSLHCGTDQELSKPGQSWLLDVPTGYPPDQAGAVDLVDAIVHARADAWVSDTDEPGFGVADSKCVIRLGVHTAAGARNVSLRFGQETEGGFYARAYDARSGSETSTPVFVAPRALHDAALGILIDRSVISIDPTHVDHVSIERGSKRVTITRIGQKLSLDDGGSLRSEDISRSLASLRADAVVHLGPPANDEGFNSPTLIARAETNGRRTSITFGRATVRTNEKMYFARIDSVNATFAVAADRITPLLDSL